MEVRALVARRQGPPTLAPGSSALSIFVRFRSEMDVIGIMPRRLYSGTKVSGATAEIAPSAALSVETVSDPTSSDSGGARCSSSSAGAPRRGERGAETLIEVARRMCSLEPPASPSRGVRSSDDGSPTLVPLPLPALMIVLM